MVEGKIRIEVTTKLNQFENKEELLKYINKEFNKTYTLEEYIEESVRQCEKNIQSLFGPKSIVEVKAAYALEDK